MRAARAGRMITSQEGEATCGECDWRLVALGSESPPLTGPSAAFYLTFTFSLAGKGQFLFVCFLSFSILFSDILPFRFLFKF